MPEPSKPPISMDSHDLLIAFASNAITNQGSWWRDRLERTDMMYYCMQSDLRNNKTLRERAEALNLEVSDMVEVPIIASQIDTAVSVLADTFLSGYPLLGVVAPPARRGEIEQLETLISHYDMTGKWRSKLLRYFRHLCKYGIAPIGLTTRYSYDLQRTLATGLAADKPIKKITPSSMPELTIPDLYNMLFDWRVAPNELHILGDYVSYAEILPATALKALLISMVESGPGNAGQVFNMDKWQTTTVPHANYYSHPIVTYPTSPSTMGRWERWYNGSALAQAHAFAVTKAFQYQDNAVLLRRFQARLVPNEFKLTRYGGATPITFEFWTVNDRWVVYFAPLYLHDNAFSITFTDLQNDDFGYGGKTETELFAPFQEASSTLLNSALLAAERMVDDRALYDPNYLSQANLTKQSGSAYIPITSSLASETRMDDVYRSIPFEASSAFQLPGLVRELVNTSTMLRGRSNFAQGLPQKGNRTLGEFSEIMNNSDTRAQLPAMQVETQAFTELKSWIKQWITSNATPQTLLNHRTRAAVEIDPKTISDLQYDFSLATGYFSKRLMASTDVLQAGLQAMQTNERLGTEYDVAAVFAYLMSMHGVKDLDQFRMQQQPQEPQQPQQPLASIQPPLAQ